jgi:transcriptional regulator with XRE-family HTH domain
MVGKIIKYMRKSNRLTQYQLSQITGIAQSTISGYETSFSMPNYREMEKIVDACNFEIAFIDKRNNETITYSNIVNKHM